jgi:hypothetical protein
MTDQSERSAARVQARRARVRRVPLSRVVVFGGGYREHESGSLGVEDTHFGQDVVETLRRWKDLESSGRWTGRRSGDHRPVPL